MAFDKTNTGILSRNDRKEKDTHPDFKGELNCNGVDGWLSGYIKERKDGNGRFFSLRWKPKDDKAPPQPLAPQDDTDIPF